MFIKKINCFGPERKQIKHLLCTLLMLVQSPPPHTVPQATPDVLPEHRARVSPKHSEIAPPPKKNKTVNVTYLPSSGHTLPK